MANVLYTRVQKNMRGDWQAETRVEVTDTLVLDILTCKRYNGNLSTTATVSHQEPGSDFISHVVYQDFSKQLVSTKPKRITSKAVEQQHATVDVEEVIAMVEEFYSLV